MSNIQEKFYYICLNNGWINNWGRGKTFIERIIYSWLNLKWKVGYNYVLSAIIIRILRKVECIIKWIGLHKNILPQKMQSHEWRLRLVNFLKRIRGKLIMYRQSRDTNEKVNEAILSGFNYWERDEFFVNEAKFWKH